MLADWLACRFAFSPLPDTALRIPGASAFLAGQGAGSVAWVRCLPFFCDADSRARNAAAAAFLVSLERGCGYSGNIVAGLVLFLS
jgi:hypothetical protein